MTNSKSFQLNLKIRNLFWELASISSDKFTITMEILLLFPTQTLSLRFQSAISSFFSLLQKLSLEVGAAIWGKSSLTFTYNKEIYIDIRSDNLGVLLQLIFRLLLPSNKYVCFDMFLHSYSYGLRLRQFYVDFVPADKKLIRLNLHEWCKSDVSRSLMFIVESLFLFERLI